MNWKKFIFFFLAFFALAIVIQLLIFETDQPVNSILLKTFLSGLVAAGVFMWITRNK